MTPAGSGLLALDADGTACSSDYYLRLTADGGRMLKGQIPLTATRPTQPTLSGGGNPPPNPNLAQNRSTAESSHIQIYSSNNAVDGNTSTYWESANNAFPQWLQVDLGAATSTQRIVLTLPPPSAWNTRTQTITVQGSTDGANFSTVVNSAGYTFDPATGNAATIRYPAATIRFVRLLFTANTGWPAGQVSEFQVYAT
ncbi:MAG TPA: discoidin domain-containing protein [Pseudonocardiaceae bacterium]